TLQIPLLAGRTFLPMGRQPQAEVIVDAAVAGRLWNDPTGQRAIGRRLRLVQPNGTWFTVVGVVGSVHDTSLAAPMTGQVYFPQVHSPDPTFAQVTRTLGVTVRGGSTSDLREAIHGLDRTVAVFNVSVMSEVVSRSMARLSFVMLILAVAAGVALSLAAIGLYGVIAYTVTLRTSEIGLRIALGAEPRRIARLVTYQGTALAGLGVVAGLGVFAVVSHVLRSLVFGVGTVDAMTVLAMAAVLLAVALGASWFPARRAARIAPVLALAVDA
ncbi:MAG TPA: FtsX-like permease family protein, partial [Gemmatimonadaceae bacterium]|nr:FtsX-like permease family protein [Gemmatimonadaceae bacterium]